MWQWLTRVPYPNLTSGQPVVAQESIEGVSAAVNAVGARAHSAMFGGAPLTSPAPRSLSRFMLTMVGNIAKCTSVTCDYPCEKGTLRILTGLLAAGGRGGAKSGTPQMLGMSSEGPLCEAAC